MPTLQRNLLSVLAVTALMGLAACNHEAGQNVDEGGFGNPTMTNEMAMTGQATAALQNRFANEVTSTINFPFNSSEITPEAQAILRKQADWILQFPELKFRVYGHTDLVGSNAYNYALGLRRAKAVVAYFASLGISTSRLQALVSYGETQPVVLTQAPEERNRRTVTQVSGFTKGAAGELNGKYAEVIFREYVAGATQVQQGTSSGSSSSSDASSSSGSSGSTGSGS
jgi:outer membrane protein OmpA-like peptidoglycan-associated protein